MNAEIGIDNMCKSITNKPIRWYSTDTLIAKDGKAISVDPNRFHWGLQVHAVDNPTVGRAVAEALLRELNPEVVTLVLNPLHYDSSGKRTYYTESADTLKRGLEEVTERLLVTLGTDSLSENGNSLLYSRKTVSAVVNYWDCVSRPWPLNNGKTPVVNSPYASWYYMAKSDVYRKISKICKTLGLPTESYIPNWTTAGSLAEIVDIVGRNKTKEEVTLIKDDSGRGGTAVPVYYPKDVERQLKMYNRLRDGILTTKQGHPVDHVLLEVGVKRKGIERDCELTGKKGKLKTKALLPIELVPLMVEGEDGVYKVASLGYRIGPKPVEVLNTQYTPSLLSTNNITAWNANQRGMDVGVLTEERRIKWGITNVEVQEAIISAKLMGLATCLVVKEIEDNVRHRSN